MTRGDLHPYRPDDPGEKWGVVTDSRGGAAAVPWKNVDHWHAEGFSVAGPYDCHSAAVAAARRVQIERRRGS